MKNLYNLINEKIFDSDLKYELFLTDKTVNDFISELKKSIKFLELIFSENQFSSSALENYFKISDLIEYRKMYFSIHENEFMIQDILKKHDLMKNSISESFDKIESFIQNSEF